MFHHDTIHRDDPHKATLLYSVEIPTYGGDTLFASGTAAYDTLDAATKKRLEGLKAVNYYVYNSVERNDKQAVDASSQAVHPVVRTHDETGRKALYVNRLMSVRIEGMEEAESDALLNALFDHSEKPEFVYTHVWRKGDLIVWDNRDSSHARTDFPADQRRLLLRTTVKGNCQPYQQPRAGISRDHMPGHLGFEAKLKTLVIEHTAPFQGLPELVADAEGLFAREGLKIEWANTNVGVDRSARTDVSIRKASIRSAAMAGCSNRAKPTCTMPANGAITAACRRPA